MIFVRIAAGLVLLSLSISLALAQSSTSILRYDKNGNVIGRTENQAAPPLRRR